MSKYLILKNYLNETLTSNIMSAKYEDGKKRISLNGMVLVPYYTLEKAEIYSHAFLPKISSKQRFY